MNSSVIPSARIEEFFHDALTGALRNQRVRARDEVVFYLGHLLAAFTRYDRADDPLGRPLALLLAEASNAEAMERLRILRRLGDAALYVAGFFADALNRSLVDVDYYIDMGGAAYDHVADHYGRWPAGEAPHALYREMAEQFSALVDVLAEVAEHHSLASNAGILRLYERWLRTDSDRLARKLSAKGVIPSRGGDGPTRH
jgi:hypothetical protein